MRWHRHLTINERDKSIKPQSPQSPQGSNRLHAFLLGDLFANLSGRHERTRRSHCKAAGATAQAVLAPRTPERRGGPRRGPPPQHRTDDDEGGGAARGARGRGPRDARRPTGTGATSPGDAASTTHCPWGLSRRTDSRRRLESLLECRRWLRQLWRPRRRENSTLRFLAKAALDDVRMLEEEAARRRVKEAEEAKAKEERKAKYEAKMQVINRRVRDGTATPAEEAAWRRWIGIEQSSSSTSTAQRRKRKMKSGKRTRRRP